MATNAPSEPTGVTVDDLTTALHNLQAFRGTCNGSGAVSDLNGVMNLKSGFGPLVQGAGDKINGYYMPRAQAVNQAIGMVQTSIDVLITNLQGTIAKYQAHEAGASGAAKTTGTGSGSGSSGSSGSNSGSTPNSGGPVKAV